MNTPSRDRLARWIAALVVPVLAFSPLPAPGVARAAAPPLRAAALSAPAAPLEQEAPPAAPAAAEVGAATIDCAHPIPGRKVLLIGEDEIAVTYKTNNHKALYDVWWDNSGSNVAYGGGHYRSDIANLADISWSAITWADLNGDRNDETVTVFKDKNKRLSAISSENSTQWTNSNGAWDGDNVADIDVAAGDLDRNGTDDEIVFAFKDDNKDVHVAALDGTGSGGIAQASNSLWGEWTDSGSNRGEVSHTSVATGDLDGDGFDDEIVVAFKDAGHDLQVMVLRRDGPTLTPLWLSGGMTAEGRGDVADTESLWGNRYPVDVTTGDVDGDKRDEAIVGFRLGDPSNGSTQLLVLKYTGQDTKGNSDPLDDKYSMDTRVFLTENLGDKYGHYVMAAPSVSLAAGDLDGDGIDEIALGIGGEILNSEHGNRQWETYLSTYEYIPVSDPDWQSFKCKDVQGDRACLHQRPGSPWYWKSGGSTIDLFEEEQKPEADVRVAAGDLDADGRDEIALLRKSHSSGDGELLTFDADSNLARRASVTFSDPADTIDRFWVAMGDGDGNTTYGTYTGACRRKDQAQIAAVIHSPPHWTEEEAPANWEEAEAGYGVSVETDASYGTATETSLGGSVTWAPELPLEEAPINIGPSFTLGWETATAVENQQSTSSGDGTKFKSHVPWAYDEASTYFDAVGVLKSVYWCYDYTDPNNGVATVCLPRPESEQKFVDYSLPTWYSDCADCPRKLYPDSWVPVGVNLAQGRTATASSFVAGNEPARALDGKTNGNFPVTPGFHSQHEATPWLEVDLGGAQAIDAVQLWNRTDCCGTRAADYYLFVSEHPFTSTVPSVLLNTPGVWSYHDAGQVGTPTVIPVNHHGRYLRVQLAGTNYLHLAEVQVFGVPGTPDLWPISKPITTTDDVTHASSFILTWPGNVQQTVAGNVVYARKGSALGPEPNAGGGGEFDLAVGEGGETMTEASTSKSFAIGVEIKPAGGGEREWGRTDKTSYALSWDNKLEFSGAVGGGIPTCAWDLAYEWKPYVWVQRATTSAGVNQAFLVLDYWVPSVGGDLPPECQTAALSAAPAAPGAPTVAPAPPVLDSPTHPDPNAWGGSTVTFAWSPGDATPLAGYRWALDQAADTAPRTINATQIVSRTYFNLPDGAWTMHVHAQSTGGEWSAVAQRSVKVDANPPAVQLSLTPPAPTGNNGWYVTPLSVAVSAEDGTGSGVALIETSADGATWQPYGAPPAFAGDTAGATLYARATDAAGNVSAVISTTFKIDQTPPDSHVAGGDGPGALIARVVAGPQGNQVLVLAGAAQDALSGQAGMDVGIDGLDWTAAGNVGVRPGVQATWRFTATHELGAGNHVFMGRAHDAAGNAEAAYEIARVLWLPTASPDLSGSSLAVSPTRIRPGEVVTFTLVARNGGFQEAHVALSAVLPPILAPVAETLPSDATYDAGTHTLTWAAPELLWPGQWAQRTFAARAGDAAAAQLYEAAAAFHAFWPSEGLTEAERAQFTAREQTVTRSAGVTVDPALPAGADATPPWVFVTRPSGKAEGGATALTLNAAPDAARLFVREWAPNPISGAWEMEQERGWSDFAPTVAWTLSAGQGVKYVGVWVMDAAGNVSTLDEGSLVFVNRADSGPAGSQTLADGERVQYRGDVALNSWMYAVITTVAGDPDIYIYEPLNGFLPDHFINDTVAPGQSESVGGKLGHTTGLALLDVQAVGASEYRVELAGASAAEAARAANPAGPKLPPAHPLTVSDPLSAGAAGAPGATLKLLLPLIFRGQ